MALFAAPAPPFTFRPALSDLLQWEEMPGVRLALLGPPEVVAGGQPRKMGAKALAVLAYLALEGRTNRRTLAGLLWPDASDPLNSLSAARTAIVKALGPDLLGGDADTLQLAGEWWCDAVEAQAEPAPDGWAEAWSLWRGPLLAGLRLPEWEQGLGEEFEEWLEAWRERLAERRRAVGLAGARAHLARGEVAQALPYLEAAGDALADPHEDAARLLILAHGALGQPDRAAAVYAALARALRDELDVEPTEATREAFELARSGDAAACRAALGGGAPAPAAAPLPEEEGDVPLVGRDADLAALLPPLANVREDGGSRAALLVGEPGAGKTRLAREIARRLLAGGETLVAAGVATPTGLPLALYDRVARTLVRSRPDAVEALPAAWRAALARFVPDLLPGGGEANAPDFERRGLAQALRALLTHDRAPALLLLDDLQWADQAALDLTLDLLQNPPPCGLMLVATLRDTESPAANLRALQSALARENLGVRHAVAGLDEAAVSALAREVGKPDADAARLRRSSGGNPFYLLELLRAGDGGPPRRLHEFVAARLDALEPEERQVLEAVAVVGDPAAEGLVKRVSGRSLDETVEALERLARAGFLRLDDDGALFGHDLTKEVLLAALSATRTSLLHLRAARARKAEPARAAVHYWASRPAWDDEDEAPALAALLEAAAVSALRGDLPGGLAWLERAEEVAGRDPARRIRVLTERARQYERYGRIQEAKEALDAADLLSGEVTDPVLRAQVWTTRATLLTVKLGLLDEAQVLVDKARAALEGLTGREAQLIYSDALHIAGTVAQQRGRYDEALEFFQQALGMRRSLQDLARERATLNNIANTHGQLGNAQAIELHLECLTISRRLGDYLSIAKSLGNLGIIYLRSGNHEESSRAIDEALRIHAMFQNKWEMANCYSTLGDGYFYKGRYRAARSHYERALQLRGETGTSDAATIGTMFNLAESFLYEGDFASSQRMLNSARSLLESYNLSRTPLAVSGLEIQAELSATRGDLAQVKASLSEAIQIYERVGKSSLAAQYRQKIELIDMMEGTAPRDDLASWRLFVLGSSSRDTTLLHESLQLADQDWHRARVLDVLADLEPDKAGEYRERATAIRSTFHSEEPLPSA